jgi:nitrite reductase/ring-hydroxylating ferredoxin subunit/uncharacterized membrane protein
MIKRLLQGALLKHPLHPALVHYPIGLLTLSLLLDIAYWFSNGLEWLTQGAVYAMVGGIGFALLAAIPGLLDWSEIRIDHPGKKWANIHMVMNLFIVGLFSLNLFLRLRVFEAETTVPTIALILSIVGIGLLFFSGYLGGMLVYDQGIGVGRYRRTTPLPRKTIRVEAKKGDEGYIRITDKDAIKEGRTLRVEVNGEVIAIALQNGKYYAFNEFCTHRYGPLSEGALYNGSVECPWHRSCFDMSTGKVVDGPAKNALKTYPLKVKEGDIFIKIPS